MLETFKKKFAHLHTDKNRHRWTPLTCHRAPHKPFLAARPLSFKIAGDFKCEVIISDRVRSDKNLPGHLQTLVDRPIIKPEKGMFWPGQENLKWHQRKRFER